MKIPQHLAYTLIEYLDLLYLNIYKKGSREEYLLFIRNYMDNTFNVSWSEGGTYGTCWSDELSEQDAQPEPPMTELEEFLNQYYPTLDSEDFSYIIESANRSETYDSDYYGGCTSQGHKKLDFEELSTLLIETFYKESIHSSNEPWIEFNDLIEQHSHIVINMRLNDYSKLKLNRNLNKNLTEDDYHIHKQKI